jgi:hypothetical protein
MITPSIRVVRLMSFLLFFCFILSPSICLSELVTVQGESCDVYLGDLKDKKELNKFRKKVRENSIRDGLKKVHKDKNTDLIYYTDECVNHIISQYLEKTEVVSHKEKNRKICKIINLTLNPDVINRYFETSCGYWTIGPAEGTEWYTDIDNVLKKVNEKIIIGLVIENRTNTVDRYKREMLENEEENQFHEIIEKSKGKYKLVDRKHLNKILEEQKLSSSGITDSETVSFP